MYQGGNRDTIISMSCQSNLGNNFLCTLEHITHTFINLR